MLKLINMAEDSYPIRPAYIGIAEPSMFLRLKQLPAKENYYFEQHKKRWERRYKQPYPDEDGEIGIICGIRWINAE
jgi:hypothetical protein